MVTNFDIDKIIDIGAITNELDYDRALIADRRLRLLAKENNHFKKLRSTLRDLIEDYENREWSNLENIDDHKIKESEKSRKAAELEMLFKTVR